MEYGLRQPVNFEANQTRLGKLEGGLLPALGFQMPRSTGVAHLTKFPAKGVYVANEPTPPGGAYLFTILA